jgi:hypothetical protein
MLSHKLNTIKKIPLGSSKNAQNIIRQNLSRKTAAAKRDWLPYLDMSKNSKKIKHTKDENLQLQFRFQLNRSYRKNQGFF